MDSSSRDPDFNFCFPVKELSNESVKITPFIPSIYSAPFFNKSQPIQTQLWSHMIVGPFDTLADFNTFIQTTIQPDQCLMLYAITDQTKPLTADPAANLEGIIAYMTASPLKRRIEIDYVAILPEYQRTHVTTNAVGLLLQHAFSLPEDGGLGFRRVIWEANSINFASQKAAERLEFRKEEVQRWCCLFKDGKKREKIGNGRPVPPGLGEDDLGRDTVVYAICWDDWKEAVKDMLETMMARTT